MIKFNKYVLLIIVGFLCGSMVFANQSYPYIDENIIEQLKLNDTVFVVVTLKEGSTMGEFLSSVNIEQINMSYSYDELSDRWFEATITNTSIEFLKNDSRILNIYISKMGYADVYPATRKVYENYYTHILVLITCLIIAVIILILTRRKRK